MKSGDCDGMQTGIHVIPLYFLLVTSPTMQLTSIGVGLLNSFMILKVEVLINPVFTCGDGAGNTVVVGAIGIA